MRKRFLRVVLAYFAAIAVTTVMACIAQTQFVLSRLIEAGAEIQPLLWVQSTLADIAGLGPGYGLIIAAALLAGFAACTALQRFTRLPDLPIFTAAGAAALLTALLLIKAVTGIMPIGGARTTLGLLVQAAIGGGGGALFCWLKGRRDQR